MCKHGFDFDFMLEKVKKKRMTCKCDVLRCKLSFISYTTSVPICKPPLHFSHFLKKVVNVIDVSVLCVNIIKLSFVCMCIKFDFSYSRQISNIN